MNSFEAVFPQLHTYTDSLLLSIFRLYLGLPDLHPYAIYPWDLFSLRMSKLFQDPKIPGARLLLQTHSVVVRGTQDIERATDPWLKPVTVV